MFKLPFRNKSKLGTKIRPVKKKSLETLTIWSNYASGFNKKRVLIEFILPFLLAFSAAVITYFAEVSPGKIAERIQNLYSLIATTLAIQIGFNITSITLITSFNRQDINKIFSSVNLEEKENVLKQLVSSFIYCIYIQTVILIVGILYSMIYLDIINMVTNITEEIKLIIAVVLYCLWIFIILHSLMAFIRNVVLIYKFILVAYKNK